MTPAELACNPDSLNALQRAAGFVSLSGTVKILGALSLLAGIGYIFWGAIRMLLEWTGFIEVVIWLTAFALIVTSYFIGDWQIFTLFPGAALISGAAIYTSHIRKIEIDVRTSGALMTLVWGILALFFHSTAVGFLAVGALMMSMGFVIGKSPLCTYIGFEDDSAIAPATSQSVILLVAYTAIKAAGMAGMLAVFEPGIFWLASLVSMVGMLILASKWYPATTGATMVMNVGAVVLYMAAIFVGQDLNIGALTTMGVIFLIFYASEKIIEIPAESAIGFGVKLVILGGFLMWAWNEMQTNAAFKHVLGG